VLFAGEEPSKGGAEDVAARPVVAAERGGRGREKNGRLQGEGRVEAVEVRRGGANTFWPFWFFSTILCANTAVFCVYPTINLSGFVYIEYLKT
jgi:hypothetical protein